MFTINHQPVTKYDKPLMNKFHLRYGFSQSFCAVQGAFECSVLWVAAADDDDDDDDDQYYFLLLQLVINDILSKLTQ